MAWGQHELLDFGGCNIDKLKCSETILKFTSDLVKAINMVAYGKPILEHFATHAPEKAGYSLIQLIETSSIVGHFAENRGELYLDVHSCKPFDQKTVIDMVRERFKAKKWKTRSVDRGDWTGDIFHEVGSYYRGFEGDDLKQLCGIMGKVA